MDMSEHTLNSLFQQLGLPETDTAIDHFIEQHKGTNRQGPLHEADFWSESQANFLQEAIEEDSDWAEIVDHLDALLRG